MGDITAASCDDDNMIEDHIDTNNNHKINKNVLKLKLSRAPSRSLDSIHGTLMDADISRLFDEISIDDLFPKVVASFAAQTHNGDENKLPLPNKFDFTGAVGLF